MKDLNILCSVIVFVLVSMAGLQAKPKPATPYEPPALEKGVPTTLDLPKDFDPPYRKNMASGAAEQDRVIDDFPSLIQHKYIVTSNKRGVGKTSLAVNLAVALSKRKVKVGLIDLDLHGTNISNMLGLQGIYETDCV